MAPIPCVRGFRSNHKTVELSFLRPWTFVLRLVTSTCAGYDDDAQICCEHGGEGGQNVSLTAEVYETTVTGGGDGPGRCCFRFSFVVVHFFLLLISLPIINWFSFQSEAA